MNKYCMYGKTFTLNNHQLEIYYMDTYDNRVYHYNVLTWCTNLYSMLFINILQIE